MAGLLVIHRSDAALERDAVAGLVGVLRDRGHAVVSCSERAGIGGGEVADLERQAEAADHILLVDPTAWWTRGPARDAWEQAVRERLEFCLANAIEQFAMIVDRSRERSALDSLLESVPRFVLPAGWEPLLARLAEPRPTINTLRTSKDLPAPRPVIPRPAVERALAQAVTTTPEHEGRLVWIRGGIGSGKTSLLSTYLSGRFAPTPAIVHVAQPGIAATLRPGAVLDRLAATLGLARLDDLRELPSDGSRATVVVIDGLEQLIDRTDALVSDAERRRFAASLAGPLPARLVVLASSRPLAPGLLGEREPTIDLDAPGWAAEQQALVDALLSTATGSEQREAMAALRELAGPNPGAARALLELRGALGEGNIPPRFAAALERSFVRLLALPVEVRQTVLAGLSLLRAGFGPLPDRLLRAALGVEAGLLEGYAAEWLRRDGELRSLTHPFAARYLASELDGDDVGPHLAILDGITRLRCRARLDAASERYAAKHERRHQQAAHGLWPDELWLRDLPHLQRMAAEGSLERKLEQAAAKVPSALVTAMSSIVRRNSHAIAEAPASLPGLLWTELVAQDIPLATVESELIWAEARPPIRLQNPLHHVDRCHRVLAGHDQPIRGCGLSRDASVAVTLSQDGVL
ncbi:MAG TPA: hypothetical protein VK034_29430, partial [Enhygromyxa sp.]|nr:hypothetical protein [Enhygromyxa sp.]